MQEPIDDTLKEVAASLAAGVLASGATPGKERDRIIDDAITIYRNVLHRLSKPSGKTV